MEFGVFLMVREVMQRPDWRPPTIAQYTDAGLQPQSWGGDVKIRGVLGISVNFISGWGLRERNVLSVTEIF